MKTVCHGSESLSNLGPRIWNLVPSTLKELDDVNSFTRQIKKWQLKTVHVGYIKRIYLLLDSYSFFILFNHFVSLNHFILYYYL